MSQREPALGSDHFPTERYEELRRAALGDGTASNGRGLALLMRQGMPAWMQAWTCCTTQQPSPREPQAKIERPVSSPEMVTVLAEMAMAAAQGWVSA